MIIFKEKKNKSSLSETFTASTKEDMFGAISKYKDLKFSLFRVGSDKNLLEAGKLIPSPAGSHLFMDNNGNICGFMNAAVSNRVDKWNDSDRVYNFNVGRTEYKLYID